MYEVSLEAGGRLLIAKASGLVQADDYDAMLEFEKLVSEARPEGMLVDWTELKGWSEESESMRFLARMQFGATLQRIAILADSSWDPEVERVETTQSGASRQSEFVVYLKQMRSGAEGMEDAG